MDRQPTGGYATDYYETTNGSGITIRYSHSTPEIAIVGTRLDQIPIYWRFGNISLQKTKN